MGESSNAREDRSRNTFVGHPEGKRPLGRSRRRWNYNIKVDHMEIGFRVWIGFM